MYPFIRVIIFIGLTILIFKAFTPNNAAVPKDIISTIRNLEGQTFGQVSDADTIIYANQPFLLPLPTKKEDGSLVSFYEVASAQKFLYITDNNLLWYPDKAEKTTLHLIGADENGIKADFKYQIEVRE